MFEKFSEQARRAIFHAREETSNFGTPQIESEQLLLGLLAADKSIFERYLGGRTNAAEIREAIVQATEVRQPGTRDNHWEQSSKQPVVWETIHLAESLPSGGSLSEQLPKVVEAI